MPEPVTVGTLSGTIAAGLINSIPVTALTALQAGYLTRGTTIIVGYNTRSAVAATVATDAVAGNVAIAIIPMTTTIDLPSGSVAAQPTYSASGTGSIPYFVAGVLPIANGGTGSAVKNFVDLTTVQSVGGVKTFTDYPLITKSIDGQGTLAILNASVGAAAYAGTIVGNSLGANRAYFIVTGANFAPSGTQLGDQLEVYSLAAAGIAINQASAAPIIFGINNIEAGRFTATGQVTFSPAAGATAVKVGAPNGFANLLLDLQVNAASVFTIDQLGRIAISGTASNTSILTNGGMKFSQTSSAALLSFHRAGGIEIFDNGVATNTEQGFSFFLNNPLVYNGNIATTRALRVGAIPINSSGGARTITNAYSLAIDGAPSVGTGGTIITNAYAFAVLAGTSLFSGHVESGVSFRAAGPTTPPNGAGIELAYIAGAGFITAYNRTGAAYTPLSLGGSTFTVLTGGTAAISVDASQIVSIPLALRGSTGTLYVQSAGANSIILGTNTGANNRWSFANTGQFYPATDAAASQTAAGIFAGTGAPNNANGNNGDIYIRSDGGALTTIYQRRTGAWAGVA